jgi:hypothetical protein
VTMSKVLVISWFVLGAFSAFTYFMLPQGPAPAVIVIISYAALFMSGYNFRAALTEQQI